jgi:hypothetical protein
LLTHLQSWARRCAVAIAGAAAIAALVASTASAAATASWSANVWRSPSGNIACRYYPTIDTVTCQTDNDRFAVAVRRYGGNGFRTYFRWIPSQTNTLDYGSNWNAPGFHCTSASDGMRCRSQSGHGFYIASDAYDIW